MGQHSNRAVNLCTRLFKYRFLQCLSNGTGCRANVVGPAERAKIWFVVRPETKALKQVGKLIYIQIKHEQIIAKLIRIRKIPAVKDGARVDSTLVIAHAATPRFLHTLIADTTPSSWNPFLRYAPQKEVLF